MEKVVEKVYNMTEKENIPTLSASELYPSFFQSSRKGSRPVFRELSDEELAAVEEVAKNKSIKSWSKGISLLPVISHKLMKDYLIDGTISIYNGNRGAFKHKILGYQLLKENYVKGVRVKPNVEVNFMLFIVKCGEILYAVCNCKIWCRWLL